MSFFVLVVLAIVGESQSDLNVPSKDFVTQQLENYFENYYKSYISKKQHDLCSYVNVGLEEARDISNWLIKTNPCPSIIPKLTEYTSKVLPSFGANFIFVSEVSGVNATIQSLKRNVLWDSRTEHHFIFCKPVKNLDFLPNLLQSIWINHVLNFVVVFVFDHLEVFSFNPFNRNEIVNVSQHPNQFFADKLQNLHGYELRVSLFEQLSLLFKDVDRWYGMDYKILKMVTTTMNATFRIVEPAFNRKDHRAAYEDVTTDKTDFCFNSFFRTYDSSMTDAEFTYPHQHNKIVVVVPVGSESSKNNVVNVFSAVVWIYIAALLLITTTILTVGSTNGNNSFTQFLLYTINSLLGNGFPSFSTKRFTIKFQLMTFILGTIILRTAFNCFLISSIVSPSSVPQMTTIAELRSSKIPVYTSQVLADLLPKEYGLTDQYVIVSAEERSKKLYSLDRGGSYVVTLRIAKNFIETVESVQTDVPFYILEEPLVVGLNTYIFQKYSPYKDRVSQILLEELQFKFSKNREEDKKVALENHSEDEDNVVLTVRHFELVFYLLVVGLVLGILAFVTELLWKREKLLK
jgi:hypothetical protein